MRSLSGGERNRLLLARLFARPANVLVLDEPTNDLDIDTLELLEDLLQDYDGTVFLVSHDRAFLDNVVTRPSSSRARAAGANTRAACRTGSRSRARAQSTGAGRAAAGAAAAAAGRDARPSRPRRPRRRRQKKLSYKEQRELETPARPDRALEQEQKRIHERTRRRRALRQQPGARGRTAGASAARRSTTN